MCCLCRMQRQVGDSNTRVHLIFLIGFTRSLARYLSVIPPVNGETRTLLDYPWLRNPLIHLRNPQQHNTHNHHSSTSPRLAQSKDPHDLVKLCGGFCLFKRGKYCSKISFASDLAQQQKHCPATKSSQLLYTGPQLSVSTHPTMHPFCCFGCGRDRPHLSIPSSIHPSILLQQTPSRNHCHILAESNEITPAAPPGQRP